MGLFGSKQPPPPEWAHSIFATTAEWHRFVRELRAALPGLGANARLDERVGYAVFSVDGRDTKIAIESAARMCAESGQPAPTLRAWIAEVQAQVHARGLDVPWDVAAPSVRVQLYNDRRCAPDLVTYEVAPDLHLTVVLDSETAIQAPTRAMVEPWGKTEDELFEHGAANVGAAVTLQRSPRVQFPLLVYGGDVSSADGPYTAVAAYLSLPELLAAIPLGALVMFPTHFTCACLLLLDDLPADAYQTMLTASTRLFASGEGALTPNVYWYRDAGIEQIPFVETKGVKAALLPDELADLLR